MAGFSVPVQTETLHSPSAPLNFPLPTEYPLLPLPQRVTNSQWLSNTDSFFVRLQHGALTIKTSLRGRIQEGLSATVKFSLPPDSRLLQLIHDKSATLQPIVEGPCKTANTGLTAADLCLRPVTTQLYKKGCIAASTSLNYMIEKCGLANAEIDHEAIDSAIIEVADRFPPKSTPELIVTISLSILAKDIFLFDQNARAAGLSPYSGVQFVTQLCRATAKIVGSELLLEEQYEVPAIRALRHTKPLKMATMDMMIRLLRDPTEDLQVGDIKALLRAFPNLSSEMIGSLAKDAIIPPPYSAEDLNPRNDDGTARRQVRGSMRVTEDTDEDDDDEENSDGSDISFSDFDFLG